MKKIILAVASVMVSVAAFAQGVVVFNNKVGTDVVARVLLPGGTGAGAGFTAQLYGGPVGGALTALSPTTSFRTSSAAAQGYVNGVNVEVPGVGAGLQATIVMKAYNGADFASSSIKGESTPITVTLGGGTLPPANLTGLAGFTMTGAVTPPPVDPVIPEPSTIALGIIGASALLLRRK